MSIYTATWGYITTAFCGCYTVNFLYHYGYRNGWLPSTSKHVMRVDLYDENPAAISENTEYRRLLMEKSSGVNVNRRSRGDASPATGELPAAQTPAMLGLGNAPITLCMRRYQEDHPDGYLLLDAAKHCNCALTPELEKKLEPILVRSQDKVDERLTRTELEIIGARPNSNDKPPLLYHEAKRLKKRGLGPGVDPSKPRNDLLERAHFGLARYGEWEHRAYANYYDNVMIHESKKGDTEYSTLWRSYRH